MKGTAMQVYDKVIEAMQPAEDIGGPEGEAYLELMGAIAGEANKRAMAYRDHGMAEDAGYHTFELLNVDGKRTTLTANEFFDDNEDLICSDEGTLIRALKVGETFNGGGGAQPEWSITRLT